MRHRILGIDPGSRITGFGIIEKVGNTYQMVAQGAWVLQGATVAARLGHLQQLLTDFLVIQQPTLASLEKIFFAKNAASALKLGHARGVILACLQQYGLEVFEYTPRCVKKTVTGTGAATKEQVQHMVRMLLELGAELPLTLDSSDALALALCHAHSSVQIPAGRTGKQTKRQQWANFYDSQDPGKTS